MPDYRRWYVSGGTYFFTAVADHRRPILCGELARRCLHEAIQAVCATRPLELLAIVLLPDHLHSVWTLPQGDASYPTRWRRIKEEFTRAYLARGGTEVPPGLSRLRQGERGIWQRRYWEHAVRDEERPETLRRLYPLESKEAWLCDKRSRLAVVFVPSVRQAGRVCGRLGRGKSVRPDMTSRNGVNRCWWDCAPLVPPYMLLLPSSALPREAAWASSFFPIARHRSRNRRRLSATCP